MKNRKLNRILGTLAVASLLMGMAGCSGDDEPKKDGESSSSTETTNGIIGDDSTEDASPSEGSSTGEDTPSVSEGSEEPDTGGPEGTDPATSDPNPNAEETDGPEPGTTGGLPEEREPNKKATPWAESPDNPANQPGKKGTKKGSTDKNGGDKTGAWWDNPNWKGTNKTDRPVKEIQKFFGLEQSGSYDHALSMEVLKYQDAMGLAETGNWTNKEDKRAFGS